MGCCVTGSNTMGEQARSVITLLCLAPEKRPDRPCWSDRLGTMRVPPLRGPPAPEDDACGVRMVNDLLVPVKT